jgi:predicted dehydrogenase
VRRIVAVRSGHGGPVEEETLIDRSFDTLEDAVKIGLDGAIICSPAVVHARQAGLLLGKGVSVLIEKPVDASLSNAKHLVEIAGRSHGVCVVGYVFRHHPGFLHIQRRVKSGDLGELIGVRAEARSFLPEWRPGRDYRNTVSAKSSLGGGVLRELSHELDYVSELFGPIVSVNAAVTRTGLLDIDVEDRAEILMENASNAPISVYLDFCSRVARRELHAWFTKGELTWDILSNRITEVDLNGNITQQTLQITRDELFIRELGHFFDCVEREVPPVCPIEDGLRVLRLIAAAERSSHSGRKITIA